MMHPIIDKTKHAIGLCRCQYMHKANQAIVKNNQYALNIFSGAVQTNQVLPALTPASISNLAFARTLKEKRQIETKSRGKIDRYFLTISITNEQIN